MNLQLQKKSRVASLTRLTAVASLVASCLAFSSAAQANISFTFDYSGNTAGVGFLDATNGAARQAALTTAGTLFSNYFGSLFSNSGNIVLAVTSTDDNTINTLASAGSEYVSVLPPGVPGLTGEVVKNKLLTGVDLNGAAADGIVDVNWGYGWQLDPNASAGVDFDFYAAIFHELTHALGFAAGMNQAGDPIFGGATDGEWTKFATFLEDKNGNDFLSPGFILDKPVFDAAIVGGGCDGTHFNGANSVAANGGNAICMFSPTTFEPGSSISHLDEATYITTMMKPTRDVGDGEARTYGAIEIGIMTDLGYTRVATNVVPEPGSIALLLAGLAGASVIRRRKA